MGTENKYEKRKPVEPRNKLSIISAIPWLLSSSLFVPNWSRLIKYKHWFNPDIPSFPPRIIAGTFIICRLMHYKSIVPNWKYTDRAVQKYSIIFFLHLSLPLSRLIISKKSYSFQNVLIPSFSLHSKSVTSSSAWQRKQKPSYKVFLNFLKPHIQFARTHASLIFVFTLEKVFSLS